MERGRATCDSRRSVRCSSMRRSAIPSTLGSSSGCWPFRRSASRSRLCRSSPLPRSTRSIEAPDRARWEGRRDRALLLVGVQTGLRVSELTGLDCGDVNLGTGANVRCEGKGRKLRAVPLTTTTEAVLKVWMSERSGRRDEPLFPTRTGRRLSTDAVERLVHKHAATAGQLCPSLRAESLHPHTLRHRCAMSLLQAGVDISVSRCGWDTPTSGLHSPISTPT